MIHPIGIAHRGASGLAPENTIEAFDLAIALGCRAIELDVRPSADGELVVIHDETVSRTLRPRDSLRSNLVAGLKWSELSILDAGSWFNDARPHLARPGYAGARLSRLDDIFRRYGREVRYFIELKNLAPTTGVEEELVRLVRMHGFLNESPAAGRLVVEAFSQKVLRRLRSIEPGIPVIQLFHYYATSAAIRAYISALPSYCGGFGCPAQAIDIPLVRAARANSLRIYAWTVNDPQQIEPLLDMHVDGIVTDYPNLLDLDTASRTEKTAELSTLGPPSERVIAGKDSCLLGTFEAGSSYSVHELDAGAKGGVASVRLEAAPEHAVLKRDRWQPKSGLAWRAEQTSKEEQFHDHTWGRDPKVRLRRPCTSTFSRSLRSER